MNEKKKYKSNERISGIIDSKIGDFSQWFNIQ